MQNKRREMMGVTKETFGTTKDGTEVYLYTIENSKGMKAKVTNFGAILTALYAPNKSGRLDDVVLGYDKLADYEVNGSFFGATVGRNANRIAGAIRLCSFLYVIIKLHISIINNNFNNIHKSH